MFIEPSCELLLFACRCRDPDRNNALLSMRRCLSSSIQLRQDMPTDWWTSCRVTRLTGSELFCLRKKGYRPHHLVLGSSAQSMGVINGFLSSWVDSQGGSNAQITELIASTRMAATAKLYDEAVEREADGVVGTSLQLVHKSNHFEVLAIGSTVLSDAPAAKKPATPAADRDNWLWSEPESGTGCDRTSTRTSEPFLTACSGEQVYCLLDCGFVPKTVAFGNDAYSRGLGGFLRSAIGSTVAAGEVMAPFPTRRVSSFHMCDAFPS